MNAAITYAKELLGIWGEDEEQVEAHMESEGFTQAEIDMAFAAIEDEVLGYSCDGSND